MILRVPLTAIRVDASDTRVRYDYRGRSVIPEELVLRRWRDRSSAAAARQHGEVFDGCRLHPQIWSTLSACTAAGLQLHAGLTAEALHEALEGVRASGVRTGPLRADKYVMVIHVLRARRLLQKVMRRERDPASPGVPDLFLWRRNDAGAVYGAGFVEVKRQYRNGDGKRCREGVSKTQQQELAFLKDLGLPARTVYLREVAR